MEWQPAGLFWGTLTGCVDPCAADCSPPTELDLFLIQLANEVAAEVSTCSPCGASLGVGIRIITHHDSRMHGEYVSVATRCRGWRRHRHTAVVTATPSDVRLGPLGPAANKWG